MCQGILFEESSHEPREFLHELNDPDLLRARSIPRRAAVEIRRQQADKIVRNIEKLRAKQAEFNAKMDDYVGNLERMLEALERRDAEDAAETKREPADARGTRVTCSACGAEEVFEHLDVLFARQSDDAFDAPTECYVSELGRIKKGVFCCGGCGSAGVTIRPR